MSIVLEKLAGKRLLFLGATAHFIEAIQAANKMCIHTLVTDYNPSAIAKKYCDQAFDIDTYSQQAILKLAVEEQVDGIFVGWSDPNVSTAQAVCEKLGLPFYATREQIECLTTKYAFKKTCRSYGIRVIQEQFVGKKLSSDIIDRLKYPVLIKPVDDGGTRGMTICHSPQECEKGFLKAVETSRSKIALVEDYIDKPSLVVIDFFIQNGEAHFISMADRPTFPAKSNNFVPLGIAYVYPSKYIDIVEEQLLSQVKRMISGLGIQYGVISFEGIVKNGLLYLIETQYRFGGTHFHRFIKSYFGIDILELMITSALTGSFMEQDFSKITPRLSQSFACMNLQVNPGIISEIIFLEQLPLIKGIEWVLQLKQKGDLIPSDGSTSQYFAKVGIRGKNRDNLFKIMEQIQKSVKILDPMGNNMARQML